MRIVTSQFTSGRRRLGAYIAHLGFVLIVVAIAISSTMGKSSEVMLNQGESTTLGAYEMTFLGALSVQEPNRDALVARVAVTRNGRPVGELLPRMNQYPTQREPIGTPSVKTRWNEDLYLSILSIDPNTQRLGLHTLINPMVGWIWFATGLMALGGCMALFPSRRRAEVLVEQPLGHYGTRVSEEGAG